MSASGPQSQTGEPSPLPDSNRRPLLTMEVPGRYARTRAIIRDTDSPANWVVAAAEMRRETSRVSFLMCPFCVRAP
jgi:hypothetical protein